MQEESILNSTTLWYSIAAVVFLAIFIKAAGRPLMGWLDGEISKVRRDLDAAHRLHAEAEATLQEYRARQQNAIKEAETIVKQAKEDAARLRDEAAIEMKQMLERHEQLALDRIRLAQEEAMAEVRAYIIDEALAEARGKLKKDTATNAGASLINQIIDDLPKLKIAKSAP
ncbi:MAG TPA: hypothetical protein DCY07_03940 [Rhodospirillaceae bacterium]|nr:hypothetical protein [Rhodospirillaceae bacterium]